MVCGATREEIIKAIGLVTLADTRCLPSLSIKGGANLRLTDEDLAQILPALFGDTPRIIAEAIMALRRVPGNRETWLTGVLDGVPSLRELAEAVRAEIDRGQSSSE